MRILLVEDDPLTRSMVAHILERLGHEAIAVASGAEALRALRDYGYPVVVTDWVMPDVDGLELCRRIRQGDGDGPYTYVIVLTSREGKERYLEAMDAGADDFINKPVDVDRLAARLRAAERVLGLHQEVKALRSLLPMCSYCKSVRDDAGRWKRIEEHLHEREDADVSHGICPTCYVVHVKPHLGE